jgi:hypothetical protein
VAAATPMKEAYFDDTLEEEAVVEVVVVVEADVSVNDHTMERACHEVDMLEGVDTRDMSECDDDGDDAEEVAQDRSALLLCGRRETLSLRESAAAVSKLCVAGRKHGDCDQYCARFEQALLHVLED